MQTIPERPLTVELIAERHERLLRRLRAIAEREGNDPQRLRILAVTKTWPIGVARAALVAGLTMFGESRIQEAEPKVAALPEAEWHFIGRLQSNKARRAIRACPVIHSVDSIDLLRRLDTLAAEEGRTPRVLLQVNAAGDLARAGITPEVVGVPWSGLTAVNVIGLMTMAPMGASAEEARVVFRAVRDLRDRLEQEAGVGLPELSMGMTADAEAAAAEGATLIRIGTALFGPRAGADGSFGMPMTGESGNDTDDGSPQP